MAVSIKDYNDLKKSINPKIRVNIPAPSKISTSDREKIFESMKSFKANAKKATGAGGALAASLSKAVEKELKAGNAVGNAVSAYLASTKIDKKVQEDVNQMYTDQQDEAQYKEGKAVFEAEGDEKAEALAKEEATERRNAIYKSITETSEKLQKAEEKYGNKTKKKGSGKNGKKSNKGKAKKG